MRRLTYRYRRWLYVRSKRALLRKRSRHDHFKNSRIGELATQDSTRLVRLMGEGRLPSVMCLDKAYSETVSVLAELRKRTLRRVAGALRRPTGRRKGRIGWVRGFRDFSPLKYISAGAALMLAAEYDRISRLSGIPPATIDLHLWDKDVKATLAALGFFDLLRINVDVPPLSTGLVIAPMVAGSDVDMSPVNEAIVGLFEKGGGDLAMRIQLASAVTDAVENVRAHAYPSQWFA